MKGSEFIRKVEKLAKEKGVKVDYTPERGKGSHGTLSYDGKETIVCNMKKELKKGTLSGMLKQIGLKLEDLS